MSKVLTQEASKMAKSIHKCQKMETRMGDRSIMDQKVSKNVLYAKKYKECQEISKCPNVSKNVSYVKIV